jgi:hypothetical protein
MSTKEMNLPLTDIRLDGRTQPRVQLNHGIVRDYAEAYKARAKFPALIVFFDRRYYWLADGFHRWRAAQRAGLSKVPCEVHEGTSGDARWYSCSANRARGLRRTNGDKRKCVFAAFKHPSGAKLSDRRIADPCGVSHNFVSNLRKELSSDDSCPPETVGKDGKVRRRKPPKQRKTKTPKSIPPIDDDIDANDGDEIHDDDKYDAANITNDRGDDDHIDTTNGAEDPGNVTVADPSDAPVVASGTPGNFSADILTPDDDPIGGDDDDIDRSNGVEIEQLIDAFDTYVLLSPVARATAATAAPSSRRRLMSVICSDLTLSLRPFWEPPQRLPAARAAAWPARIRSVLTSFSY